MEIVTYSILLRFTVVSLADADSETLVINGFVRARSHRKAPLVSEVPSHLRSHWSQSQLIYAIDLAEVRLYASKGRDWELEGTSGGLGCLLSVNLLVVASLGSLRRDQRRQKTRLGSHKLRLELTEARSGMADSCVVYTKAGETDVSRGHL